MEPQFLSRKDTMIRNSIICSLQVASICAGLVWIIVAFPRDVTLYHGILSISFIAINIALMTYFRRSFGRFWMPVSLLYRDGSFVARNLWNHCENIEPTQIVRVSERRVNRAPPLVEVTYINAETRKVERFCFHPRHSVENALHYFRGDETGTRTVMATRT